MSLQSNVMSSVIKLAVFLGCMTACTKEPDTTFDQEAVLSSFQIDENFQIEVIAHEPLIADPVAMEIDENGKMYVVQMHGYPLDKSGSGSIKVLSDTDGDGVMDKAVVFADGLMLPNGIMRWKKGIIVTDAPHVYYLEDTDGDDVADIKETLLTGFALTNPQHKVNSPKYSIDNWIYMGNEPYTVAKIYVDEFGDTGTPVHYVSMKDGPQLPANANGRAVRFRPSTQGLEMLSTATQFSNAEDQWGRHFFGNNTNHIYNEVIPSRYLLRNSHLSVASSIHTMSSYGMPAEVYPITEGTEHQIFTDIGVFTSACGTAIYKGGLFPEQFHNAAFIAEPVSNVVHAARITKDGVSFKAERIYDKKEFLASKDPWFRPVNHYIGPDGALYVLDYHRRYIEHPEWMADDVVKSGALYEGRDQGRIYRITPKGTPKPEWVKGLKLSEQSNEELINYLGHTNSWYRLTAQRLLVDRQENALKEVLVNRIKTSSNDVEKLHVAWTLEGLGVLDSNVVELLLTSTSPELRENAILLAELLSKNQPMILEKLLVLHQDPDLRVKFQLLATLGEGTTPEIQTIRQNLLFTHKENPWIQIAGLSGKELDYQRLLSQAIKTFSSQSNADKLFIERLASMQLQKGNLDDIKSMIKLALTSKDRHQGSWQAALLNGLSKDVKSVDYKSETFLDERSQLLKAAFENSYPAVKSASINLLKLVGLPSNDKTEEVIKRSLQIANNQKAPDEDRLLAMTLLSIEGAAKYENLYYDLLNPKQLLSIQKASLNILSSISGIQITNYLRDQWSSLSPQLRDQAIGIFLSTEERTVVLIEALEKGAIDPSSINFYQQIYLMTLSNEALRMRTRKLFKDESKDQERKKIIESYKVALTVNGNEDNGRILFEKNCSTCHQINGKLGTSFGPDLGSIRNRRPESILTDILDPSLSIADGYDLWEVTLTNGTTKQGIISTETPTTISLSVFGIEPEVINRNEIQSIRALNTTMMPSGFENSINHEEMADLLAFLRKARLI